MEEVPSEFHILALTDPLFAAEGMDIENAAHALDSLESAFTVVEREYAGTSLFRKLFFTRYPLRRYAVPMSFLRSFLECEKRRRAYFNSPTRENAEALVGGWEEAAQHLAQDTGRYRTLHRLLVRLESDEEKFVTQDMYGYLIPYRHLENVLTLFSKNAEEVRRQVLGRRQLLTSGVPIADAVRPYKVASLPHLAACAMTDEQEQFQNAAVAGGTWPFRYGDIVETHGPFRYRLENFDGKPTDRVFMFYILRDKKTAHKFMWVALVDRFFFFDFWQFQPKQDGITRGKFAPSVSMTREEMPFWHEPATNLYNSRDATYWMDISTAVDAKRRPELDRNLIAVQRSSMFDMILQECARDTRSMVAHLRRRARSHVQDSFSKFHDMLMRTFPGVYYLPFNGSVWRLPEPLPLLGERYVPPDPGKSLSEERIRKEFTPEILAAAMSSGRLREERGRAEGWLP